MISHLIELYDKTDGTPNKEKNDNKTKKKLFEWTFEINVRKENS